MKMAFYLCGLSSKNYDLILIMRKTLEKFQLRYILQSAYSVLFKIFKVIKSEQMFVSLLPSPNLKS